MTMRRVVLRDLPVELYMRTRERAEALLREFAIVAESDPDERESTPGRLLELVEELRSRYSGFTDDIQLRIEDALGRGEQSIDLELDVPEELRDDAARLAALLDEVDDFCRNGALLTLAAPPPLRNLRTWYLREFVRQLDGAPPTPWPDWSPDQSAA